MERQLIIDKLDELYDKADKNNIGLNETELEYKESVADWIEELTSTKANEAKTRNDSESGCKKGIDYEWCKVWETKGECIGCENYIQP